MQWLKGIKELEQPLKASVVTIGNFDGLHLGHQELIHKVLELSTSLDVASVVMTFHPHPQKVLFPEREIHRIFPISDQKEFLSKKQINYYITEPFSRALSDLSPERFIVDWLVRPLQPKALVVGYDFSFGANRKGSIDFLKQQSQLHGFELYVIPPYKVEGEIVSSTAIRKAIESAEIEKANLFMGRPFYIEGMIEKGKGRGKTIGFPTANVYTVSETLPAKGVYACKVYYKDKVYTGVTNVGNNPTFEEKTKRLLQIETHILDFDKDIYGEDLRIEFIEYLRGEKKFSGVEELVAQIKKDISSVREKYA